MRLLKDSSIGIGTNIAANITQCNTQIEAIKTILAKALSMLLAAVTQNWLFRDAASTYYIRVALPSYVK